MDTNNQSSFGSHPKFPKGFLNEIWHFRKTVDLDDFYSSRHPGIFLIPRSNFLEVTDSFNDSIGFEKIQFPFNSFDFFIEFERNKDGVFFSLTKNSAFWRMGGISRLGYLVPNKDETDCDYQKIFYLMPAFPHNRWIHSLITAVLAELILARNNFSFKLRAPLVLAAGSHDIATPAGGDSVMRIDKEELDEELNYSWILNYYQLNKEWTKKFNFNLEEAQNWVNGDGLFGHLFDIVDKISYTCLDCYQLGFQKNNPIRVFCNENPLVMDIWQDILFDRKLKIFYFKNPKRLFNFLYLRASEHSELLFDPRSRALDFYLEKYVGKLYRKGIVTKIDLLTKNDEWLHSVLEKHFPEQFNALISPDILAWKKFETKRAMEDFCSKIDPKKIDHTDYIKGFKLGINWLVKHNGEIVKLKNCLEKEKKQLLQDIVNSVKGYYIYYQR